MKDLFGEVPKQDVDALGFLIKFARKNEQDGLFAVSDELEAA